MPGVRSIAMKSIRTTILTSYRNRSGALWGPIFLKKLIIIHPRKKKFKSKWCRILFKYWSCTNTFSFFLNNKQKLHGGPCTSSRLQPPPKFIYINIFWTYIIFTKTYDNYHVSKPVLWQLMIYFCPVHSLIRLYFHWCNVFIHARTFFTLAGTILYQLWSPSFTVINEVWQRANRAVVTNNWAMIIEVMLIEGFL